MFELTLSTSVNKQKYLCSLYKQLADDVKSDGGIITKHNHQGRSYLAIAVTVDKKEYYKAKLLDYILFMIVDDYKFNYYKEELMAVSENILHQSFLKAISIFDYEYDREYIAKQIELSGELFIDSFYFFKLQGLREKWERTAFILRQNNVLSNNDSIIEILRYLSSVSENKVMKLDVFAGKSKIQSKSLFNKKLFKNNNIGYSGFLTEVVKLNPKKINLKVSRLNEGFDEVMEILEQIYGDKIYLQT